MHLLVTIKAVKEKPIWAKDIFDCRHIKLYTDYQKVVYSDGDRFEYPVSQCFTGSAKSCCQSSGFSVGMNIFLYVFVFISPKLKMPQCQA